MYSDEEESQELPYINYKQKYRDLKKHLHALIHENECFQEELRKAQRNFVSISKDRSFLLDRILKYEKPTGFTDSDLTESSGEEEEPKTSAPPFGQKKKSCKKRKSDADLLHNGTVDESKSNIKITNKIAGIRPILPTSHTSSSNKKPRRSGGSRKTPGKKDKTSFGISPYTLPPEKSYGISDSRPTQIHERRMSNLGDCTDGSTRMTQSEPSMDSHKHTMMTREEVERHLEARRKISPELELNTTSTVPAELFSQGPDSDYEGSDFVQLEDDGASADMIIN